MVKLVQRQMQENKRTQLQPVENIRVRLLNYVQDQLMPHRPIKS